MSTQTRNARIQQFLHAANWGDAQRQALPLDASTRRYERLVLGDKHAILMDAPPGAEASACPPNATAQQRAALGYNALARLAGPDTRAFFAIATELSARGFSPPRIYAADHDHGLLLLEDLGDALFAKLASEKTVGEDILYSAATEMLAALTRCSFQPQMPPTQPQWQVQDYDQHALLAETDLLLQWYAPHLGSTPDDQACAHIRAAWAESFTALDALPKVLVMRDVHAENLLWLPDRDAHARTGLLDFQDAVFGSPAYDLVSLLQDARRDLPHGLEDQMKALFLERSKINDHDAFHASYAILGAQRAAKILGIFVRLAERDHKPRYLEFLPRTAAHFVRNLQHPALAEIETWARRHFGALFEATP